MYCNKCGNKLTDNMTTCASCGAAQNTKEIFVYDYKTLQTSRKTAAETVDCYQSLGWELVRNNDTFSPLTTSLEFKRKRKIDNKEQLNRIQVRLDDALDSLNVMEKNKTKKAFTVAMFIGVLGLLMLGGGMSMIMAFGKPLLWMWITGISLGVAGFALCGLGYLAYTKICTKKTAEMNTLIEQKRDDICALCEDAQKLSN